MNTQEIQNLIKELLEKATVSVKEIIVSGGGNKTTLFSVEVAETHLFTAREGEALASLNHLVRRIVESKMPDNNEDKISILIDIGDFQKKRIESIHAVAHMMAERARYFKSNIEVDPMSAFDRRIVHEFLADATDLKTESDGVGPSRRVIIKYTGA